MYLVSQENVCKTVNDETCSTEYKEECRTEEVEPEDCGKKEELCSTVYDIVSNIQCSEIEENQCRTFYVPECETIQGLEDYILDPYH